MVDALDQAADSGDRQGGAGAFRQAGRRRRGCRPAPGTGRLESASIGWIRWQDAHRLRGLAACPRWPSHSLRCCSSARCQRCWRGRRGAAGRRAPRSCCGSPSRWPRCCPPSARGSRSPAIVRAWPRRQPTATITSEIAVPRVAAVADLHPGLALTSADRRAAGGGRRRGSPSPPRRRRAHHRMVVDLLGGAPHRHAWAACCTSPNRWPTACRGSAAGWSSRGHAVGAEPTPRSPRSCPTSGRTPGPATTWCRGVHRGAHRLSPVRPQRRCSTAVRLLVELLADDAAGAPCGPDSLAARPGRMRVCAEVRSPAGGPNHGCCGCSGWPVSTNSLLLALPPTPPPRRSRPAHHRGRRCPGSPSCTGCSSLTSPAQQNPMS